MTSAVERARDVLERADRIVVLTGAGISAESGVPTFRGPHGVWKSHKPEDLATPEAFARDPRTVWEWYAWRRSVVGGCLPNDGHLALARLALTRDRTTLVTQNVDGLHHRAADSLAGPSGGAERVYPLEVHGALRRDLCCRCRRRSSGLQRVDTSSADTLPRCSACRGILRPDVVWFGEALDPEVLAAAFDATREADVCLVVGTSAVVYPAAAIPEIALRCGAPVLEINPEVTPLSPSATVSVRAAATATLPAVIGWPTSTDLGRQVQSSSR